MTNSRSHRGLAALVALAFAASAVIVGAGPVSPAAAADPPYDGVYGGIALVDAEGDVIAGAYVDISAASGLPGSPAAMLTDANGIAAIDARFNTDDAWSGTQFGTVSISIFPLSSPETGSFFHLTESGVSTEFVNLAELQFLDTSDTVLELTIPIDQPDGRIAGLVTIDGGMPGGEASQFQGWADLFDSTTGDYLGSATVPAAGGGYSFTGVPDGDYLVNFVFYGASDTYPQGFVDVWYSNGFTHELATNLTIDGGNLATANQTMFEAAYIGGYINLDTPSGSTPWLAADGAPFWPAASVYPATESAKSADARIVFSDSEIPGGTGYFAVAVPNGDYRVSYGLFPSQGGFTSASEFIPLGSYPDLIEVQAGGLYQPRNGVMPGFSDVATTNQFINEITWLAATGISTGYLDRSFRPLAAVNRDAMAAFLYRAAGEPEWEPPAVSPFTDVATSNQFYAEITWLQSTGITTGYLDGTFRPLEPVNRDAMAAFLYRFADEPEFTAPVTSPFTDVTTSTQFYKEITWLRSTGISTGYVDSTYRPLVPVARDAMAAFLFRYDDLFSSDIS